MSHAVNCYLFDRTDNLLAEVQPDIELIVWRLNREGLAKFFLPFSNGKAIPDNLRFGGRVVFQFEDGHPPWGGVIDPPRVRTFDGVKITAWTGERLLKWRRTAKGKYYSAAPAGSIYQDLIEDENAEYPTGLTVGDIYAGGDGRSPEYHYHQVYERVRALARLSGNDFYIRPVYDAGVLTFYADWFQFRGADKRESVYLVGGKNVQRVKLIETGTIANKGYVAGAGHGWSGDRPSKEAQDLASMDLYGYREYAEIQSTVVNEATLQINVDQLIADKANPEENFELGGVLDTDPADYAAYDVGDIVTLEAFQNAGDWAFTGPVRITGREWRPGTRTLAVQTWRG